MNTKKLISFFLTLCIVLSTVSVVSAASEDTLTSGGQTVLYTDNFDTGIAKWTASNSKYFSGNTGKLVYKNYIGGAFYDTIENSEFTISNASVSFDMKATSPVDFAAKVRAYGKNSYNVTFDYAANKVRISNVANDVNYLLKEGQYKLSDNVKYNVVISVVGPEIIVKINNQQVVKATDKKLVEGYIGFTAKKGQYEIDNLVINEVKYEKPETTVDTGKTTKIYVAPDGNDETGDGSYEKPFATMEKAKEFKNSFNESIDIYDKVLYDKYSSFYANTYSVFANNID